MTRSFELEWERVERELASSLNVQELMGQVEQRPEYRTITL